jgi:colicin import membrane protein
MSGFVRTHAKSIIGSVLFHAGVVAVLILSVDFRTPSRPPPPQPIVQARAVDAERVDAEVERLRRQEQEARAAEVARQRELDRKAREAEQKRVDEEKRLAEAKVERERLQQLEQQRKAEVDRQVEAERQAEAKRKLDAERQAEEKRKAEEQRLAEEKREAEEKRKAEEKRQKELQEALAAEEREREEAEQLRRDDAEIQRYIAQITAKVDAAFQVSGQASGLKCTLRLKLIPGGEVAETVIVQSSGSPVFDRQAQLAVLKAVPLPLPGDPRLFRKMQEIEFEFDPNR